MTIEEEYKKWCVDPYTGNTTEERKKLGQFFTPPELTKQMIDMFEGGIRGKTIMDPTAGNGNLIAGCILYGGADPKLCYANELDPNIYKQLVERLTGLGVPEENIWNMDVLSDEFTERCKTIC